MNVFSELVDNWHVIADECLGLPFNKIEDISRFKSREQIAQYLISFDSPSWVAGWDGYNNWLNWGIAIDYQFPLGDVGLPKTVAILRKFDNIKFSCLSILKAGAILPIHEHKEMANEGLMTFHLGLNVPQQCYINVDGKFIQHESGKGIIFNGALPHYAFNASTRDRLILHCEFLSNGEKTS